MSTAIKYIHLRIDFRGGVYVKESYRDGIIYENKEISPKIYELTLDGDFQGEPGQFYMLRGWNGLDPFLPRPISICDLEEGRLKLLYEVRGRGTHIISKLKKGDKLSLLGPLGNSFNLEEERRVALISGGVGIAPMLYLAKSLNAQVDIYSGFRKEAYFLDNFKAYTNNIFFSTEDGSSGHKGFITEIFNPLDYDLVYTCGPTPMMNAVMDICKDKVPVYVSMESNMACGIGACLGCSIETTNGMKRVCKEGPIFKGEEIIR